MDQTAAAQQTDLDSLVRELETRLPHASAEAVRGLTRRLYRRGLTDVLNGRPLSGVAEDVAALYELLDGADPKAVSVRVAWDSDDPSRGVLQTVMEDRPFIVDTLREYVHSLDLDMPHLRHPVVVVDRDASGHVLDIRDRSVDGVRTSVVHIAASLIV